MSHKSNPPPDIQRGAAPSENTPASRGSERVVESQDLLGPSEQVLIRHDGRLYCLRRTRLGKLILTA